MRNFLVRTALLVTVLLGVLVAPAHAKVWKGMTPGKSNRAEVVGRFGKPTKELKDQGECQVILGYTNDEKITGARQAQFCLSKEDRLVYIIVFPDVTLDKDTVKEAFGEEFKKKLTDDFVVYWFFEKDGLVVFFDKDGKEVQSIRYMEGKTGGKKTE